MPATPARDHIAAILIVVLLHVLAFVSLVTRDGGGKPGDGPANATGVGRQDWIEVNFLEKQAEAKPAAVAVVIAASPAQAEAEDPRASKAAATQADDKAAQDKPSTETAREGGGAAAPQDDLGTRYLAAVRAAVLEQWHAQGGGDIPGGCKVAIDQATGGKALRAWVMQCSELSLGERIRLETAVMQQPLPYAGFEPVFQGHLELLF